MSDDPAIRKVLNAAGTKARFVMTYPEGEAELEISLTTPTLVIADHTLVPEALEGRGIARKLLDALLEDALAGGYKIMPLCPYVNAQRKKHPEWADLFSV